MTSRRWLCAFAVLVLVLVPNYGLAVAAATARTDAPVRYPVNPAPAPEVPLGGKPGVSNDALAIPTRDRCVRWVKAHAQN